MIELLTDPLQFTFMPRAILVGSVLAAACAVMSCFLVLRGWSLMGDAISHAVLPGIVLAHLAGLPLAAGAFASGLACALGSGWLRGVTRIKPDTAMGVVFTGMFAVGIVLFSKNPTDLHLDHILFGNIIGITRAQAAETLALATTAMVVLLVFVRNFALVSFDPSHARAIGMRVSFWDACLLAMLALCVVAGVQAVGVILVVAMLITPGATALLFTRRLKRALCIAAGTAVFSTIAGVYAAYYLDGSAAACIVLVQTAIFIAGLFRK